MNGLEKVVECIRADASEQCREIELSSANKCAAIAEEYSKREQEEYWKVINQGTKDAEIRLKKLGELAASEAKKQLISMRQEMLVEAFSLATDKLRRLSDEEFSVLLTKSGLPIGTKPEELVVHHMEILSRAVISILFD